MVGCSNVSHEKGKLIDLTLDELQTKIDNKDSFILLITKENCPYCENLMAGLQKSIDEHDKDIWRIEINPSNRDDLLPILNENLSNFESVPFVSLLENGTEYKNSMNNDISNDENFWKFIILNE